MSKPKKLTKRQRRELLGVYDGIRKGFGRKRTIWFKNKRVYSRKKKYKKDCGDE